MKKITLLISITIFGWIGWLLGAHISLMTAYGIRVIGSIFGVIIGVRVSQNYME